MFVGGGGIWGLYLRFLSDRYDIGQVGAYWKGECRIDGGGGSGGDWCNIEGDHVKLDWFALLNIV